VSGEGKVGELPGSERGHLEHLVAGGRRFAVPQPRLEGDGDHPAAVAPDDVVDAKELRDLDCGFDLLLALPHRCSGGVLVLVHKAAREAPEPIARIDRAATGDESAIRLDQDDRGYERVAPEDKAAARAGLDLLAVDIPPLQLVPALLTEVVARGTSILSKRVQRP